MNVEYIKEFIILANCLSFADTAKLTFTSKPSLSRHIKELEKDLGYDLFIRDSHHTELTAKGKFFLKKVEPVLTEFENVIAPLSENREHDKLVVGLHYAEAFDEYYSYIKSFINEHPETKIQIVNTRDHNFPELLFKGEIDVALEQFTAAHVHSDIICINLKKQKFVAAYQSSRNLKKNPLNIKTLPKERILILTEDEHPGAVEIVKLIEDNNKIKLDNVNQISGVEIMLAEVALGKGVALVPESYKKIVPKDVSAAFFKGLPERPITALFLNNGSNPDIAKFVSYLIKISK